MVLLATWVSASPQADRVVVVANSKDRDSVEIARHYMAKRAIPEENLILLETSTSEDIDWDEFVETIFNPLRRKLFEAGWIQGSVSEVKDPVGRLGVASLGQRMDFLVVCRIPLRINNDAVLLERDPRPPAQKEFATNQAAVDSELALLAIGQTPVTGFVPNPLYGQLRPSSLLLQQVVRVARLDAPSVSAAKALVDRALEAEAKGLRGRAYIDMGGPHAQGEDWMRQTGERLEAMHFPVTWERTPAEIDYTERFDAPAVYFGWWKVNITGPVRQRDFRFPPGAVGWHLHSFSANSLRRNNFRWAGPLVERGMTATVGNVFEPYLELTHRPQVFMEALERGSTVGEAAYASLPALSWMAVLVGDPLYRPFAVSLREQLAMIPGDSPDGLGQYVVLREMERLSAEEGAMAAYRYGMARRHSAPGLALYMRLAELTAIQGERAEAVKLLAPATQVVRFSADELGLAWLIANQLWQLDAREEAFAVIRTLAGSGLSDAARKAYLPTAVNWGNTLRKTREVQEWSEALADITRREEEARQRREERNRR